MPFMHLNIRQEGSVRICNRACLSIEIDDKPASLYEHSLEQIWNSDYVRDVRKALIEGKEVDACSWCYEHERKYDQSHRTVSNNEWLSKIEGGENTAETRQKAMDSIVERSIGQDFTEDKLPVYYHMNLGRLCNLKCRMCNSGNSSQIERDPVHRAWAPANVNFASGTARWIADELKVMPFQTHAVKLTGMRPVKRIHGVPVSWTDAGGEGTMSLKLSQDDWPEHIKVGIKKQIVSDRDVDIFFNGTIVFSGHVGVAGLDKSFAAPAYPLRNGTAISRLAARFKALISTPPPADVSRELNIRISSTRPPMNGSPREPSGVPVTNISLMRTPTAPKDDTRSDILRSRLGDQKEWFTHDSLIDTEILKEKDQLRMVGFTGGEPFLQEEVWTLLKSIYDAGEAPHVSVRSNTNLTALQDWQYDLLQSFEKVYIAASADALGKRFEYIRYPGRWSRAEKNLEKLASIPSVRLTIVPVVQILSIDDCVDIIKLCVDKGYELSFQHGYFPDYLSVTTLPRPLREKYAKDLRDAAFLATSNAMQDNIMSIVEYLEGERDTFNQEVIGRFMMFTNDLDAGRKQNFGTVYPEILEAFDSHGFPWDDAFRHFVKKA